MAVSYEQWTHAAAESAVGYYPSHPESSYAAACSLLMTSQYGTQQQLPGYGGDTTSHTYVREVLSSTNVFFESVSWLCDGLT